jgi:ribonuclease HI
MIDKIEEFNEYREKMNEIILKEGNLHTKRFFNLDTQVYKDGVLSKKNKELLGLTSSLVLRCDDCITYHIINAVKAGWSKKEIYEAMNVALIVGGSIVIPHIRKAAELIEEIEKENENEDKVKRDIFQLYTDGACSGNPGPGGYAALILKNNKEVEKITGAVKDTTNNRMELKAVIEGLKRIKKGSRVKLYSDSTYVLNGLSEWINNWKKNSWKTTSKKDVANKDLWQELDSLAVNFQLEFNKVKGHSGDKYNEEVDSLAKKSADEI